MVSFMKDLGKSVVNKTLNPIKNLTKDKAEFNIELNVQSIQIVTNKTVKVTVKVRRGNKDAFVSKPTVVKQGDQPKVVNFSELAAHIESTIFSKEIDGKATPQPKEGEIQVHFSTMDSNSQTLVASYKTLNFCKHFGA